MALTVENMEQFSRTLDNAQKDDTPFLAVSDGKASVIGNPTKTEKKVTDYKILFGLPPEWRDRIGNAKIIRETEDEITVEATFKKVFIPGRYRMDVVTAVTGVLPFLRKTAPNGEVQEFTIDEYSDIVNSLNREVMSALYDVIKTVLRLDDDIADCMLPMSAIVTALQMFESMPDALNEADLFTESFVGKR